MPYVLTGYVLATRRTLSGFQILTQFVVSFTIVSIGVAPNAQLRTCVIKTNNIQGRGPNVVAVIYHTHRLSSKPEIAYH